jgi:saccharopine dehydrogenase-like NADP-dependent oxidoreductase
VKVCVMGGAGRMALGAVREFVEHDEVEALVLADADAAALRGRVESLDSAKVSQVVVDVTDRAGMVAALDGCDVCLNATLPYFNEGIMEACLAAGCHYTDMGGLFHWAAKQLAMSDRFAAAGLTAICGSGSAPGIVNVMARYAALRLDTVEWVRIRDGIVNFAPAWAPLVPPYSLDTLLNEFMMDPWIFKDGEWREMTPFSGAEVIDFPEPVGTQTCFYTIHSEPQTIPVSFRDKGIREVSFQLSLPKAFEDKLRFVVELGLADKDALQVGQTSVVPRDVLMALVDRSLAAAGEAATASGRTPPPPDDHKVLRVDVRGTRDGQVQDYRLESIQHPYPAWGMSCGAFTVGFLSAVTVLLLGRGVITERGAFGGEACIPPEAYFAECNRRDIHVDVAQTCAY